MASNITVVEIMAAERPLGACDERTAGAPPKESFRCCELNSGSGSSPGIDRISGLYLGLTTVGGSPSAKKRPLIRRR
jgi:hypothetical protein